MSRISVPFPIPAWVPVQDTIFREGGVRLRLRAAAHVEDLLIDDADYIAPPYWATLWPSAVGLARFLVRRRLRGGGPVLELGAGAGLPGLALRAMGEQVIQTDLFPESLQLCRWNAQRNGRDDIATIAADWQHWPLRARFPLVIGSDLLYERVLHEALRETLCRTLLPAGVAFLADPGRPPGLTFAAACEAEGWPILLHEVQENDRTIFIYEMRLPAGAARSDGTD